MVSFSLKHPVALHILRVGVPIGLPVPRVILSPSLLRIPLIVPVRLIRAKLALAPLSPSGPLAFLPGAISLMGYIGAGPKPISTVLASPFHFALRFHNPSESIMRRAPYEEQSRSA